MVHQLVTVTKPLTDSEVDQEAPEVLEVMVDPVRIRNKVKGLYQPTKSPTPSEVDNRLSRTRSSPPSVLQNLRRSTSLTLRELILLPSQFSLPLTSSPYLYRNRRKFPKQRHLQYLLNHLKIPKSSKTSILTL